MISISDRQIVKKGGLKELLFLFFPILLITFSNGIFLLIEKIFLAQLSKQALEAAVNVAYACQIFQGSCVALAMMAQVSIGRWHGAGQLTMMGPGMWQFIWFSFLSMLVTVPLSMAYGYYYFKGTAIAEIAMPYFYFLTAVNFIYPLGAALTSFFIGQKKTRLVLYSTIALQISKIALGYLLIFGWGIIPGFGLIGGAMSTFIAQAAFCLLLFIIFINRKNAELHHSRNWQFNYRLFIDCIYPGTLRAFNRLLNFLCWAAIAHLMVAKGGDYTLALSIGGTLFLFIPFLADAVCQAQTTVLSQIIGSEQKSYMKQAFRSGTVLAIFIILLVAIPLLAFPIETFTYLFSSIDLAEAMIKNIFLGVWISFIFYTLSYIPISCVLAFKDMKFSLFMGFMGWINGFVLMYVAIEILQIAADQFWIFLSLMHGINALLYYLRMKKISSQWLYNPEAELAKS